MEKMSIKRLWKFDEAVVDACRKALRDYDVTAKKAYHSNSDKYVALTYFTLSHVFCEKGPCPTSIFGDSSTSHITLPFPCCR